MNTVIASVLSQYVKGDVNENMPDTEIDISSIGEVFDKWLEFNGIIGYGTEIRKVLFDIIWSSKEGIGSDDFKIREMASLFGLEPKELLS